MSVRHRAKGPSRTPGGTAIESSRNRNHTLGEDEGKKKGQRIGLRKGRREGRLDVLASLFERRLGRPLTDDQRAELKRRLSTLGAERLGDVVLDLSARKLAAWLADPDSR